MSGGFRYTPEAVQRWYALLSRIEALVAGGMDGAEAYITAAWEVDWQDREREEQRKFADIRENGT